MSKGFTLIELIIVIAIITILSGIVLFSTSLYINKGKDSNISGNLAILVPAGEVFYNSHNNNYDDFCNPAVSAGSVLKNILAQMPKNPTLTPDCNGNDAAVCCGNDLALNSQAWAACAQEFADPTKAYCVDSRGVKEDMCNSFCVPGIHVCPDVTACS